MAHKLYHVEYDALVEICVFHKLCVYVCVWYSDDNDANDVNDFASSRDYERASVFHP